MLIKSGVYVFVSSGKTPLIPKFNKIDTQLTQDEREQAIEKYEADHGEGMIHDRYTYRQRRRLCQRRRRA